MNEAFFAPLRHETPAFVLRSFDVGDGPKLADAVNSSYDHLHEFMAWAKPFQSIEESERRVREFRARFLTHKDFVIGVFSVDDRQLLGSCGFHLREGPLSSGNAEIGMWVRASAAGQGLGTAILKAMLAWGFTAWPFERLSWRVWPHNAASIRTAEKAGMLYEGRARSFSINHHDGKRLDSLMYGLTKADWQQTRQATSDETNK